MTSGKTKTTWTITLCGNVCVHDIVIWWDEMWKRFILFTLFPVLFIYIYFVLFFQQVHVCITLYFTCNRVHNQKVMEVHVLCVQWYKFIKSLVQLVIKTKKKTHTHTLWLSKSENKKKIQRKDSSKLQQ